MIGFPFLRGFLRTLVGLSNRSGSFWSIGRSTMNDIEAARWRRAMRNSGRQPAPWSTEIPPPPTLRPVLHSPDMYRALLARSGASLRPARRSAAHGDLILDEHGDLVPLL